MARGFWDRLDIAETYHNAGEYDKAIKVMRDVYDNYAEGRIHKAIALNQLAMSYEAMHDYQNAAARYEDAFAMTMNEDMEKHYLQKANELRAKINLPPLVPIPPDEREPYSVTEARLKKSD